MLSLLGAGGTRLCRRPRIPTRQSAQAQALSFPLAPTKTDPKQVTGGRNGYGAKLANIFSTSFVVETADGSRQRRFKQTFSDNMSRKSAPDVKPCKASDNWTAITFSPDLAKFDMEYLEDDVVALMRKRVYDLAGVLGKSVKVRGAQERERE